MARKKFTDFLIEKKLISNKDLSKTLVTYKKEGGSLIELLISSGFIEEVQLADALSEFLSIPPIKVGSLHVSKEMLDLIPQKIARSYQVLPIGKIGTTLTLAMGDPLNLVAIDDIKKITKCEINPVVCLFSEIQQAISSYYAKEATESIEKILTGQDIESLEFVKETDGVVSQDDVIRSIDEAPVIKFTNSILKRAVEEKASDILIEPMAHVSRVRFRLDGILKEVETFPQKIHSFAISRIKVMCNLDISEHRLPQEGRFRGRILNRDIDFRVSILPSSLGEKVAIRVLDKQTALLDLDLLGFEKDVLKKIKKDTLKSHGMVLTCGPTGAGKTTTLYSMLSYVYTPEQNIVTVEDPIEYQLKGINQVSVNPTINLTFSTCLRSILRQDPDIIMVGEIRDGVTADMAIKSALTGHLVLSTLHTTTSAGSVTRLINMGIEPFLLSSTLISVLAQRLVRRLCPKCKEALDTPDSLREKCKINKKAVIYKAKGCEACKGTGYKGRISLCEYLQVLPQMRKLINSAATESVLKKEARSAGMHTLREDGILKLEQGVTTLEEVLNNTHTDE